MNENFYFECSEIFYLPDGDWGSPWQNTLGWQKWEIGSQKQPEQEHELLILYSKDKVKLSEIIQTFSKENVIPYQAYEE